MTKRKEIIQLVDELSRKNPNMSKVHQLCMTLDLQTSHDLEKQMQIVLKSLNKFKSTEFKQLKQ